jgi:anaerobic magnesium-protoporphyrin IX monomethyl ester cyclase
MATACFGTMDARLPGSESTMSWECTGRPAIVLVDPPYYRLYKPTYSLTRYPLSLAYLAGEVRRRTDWNVTVYNADFTPHNEPYQIRHLCGRGFREYVSNLQDVAAPIWREVAGVIADCRPDVVGISCKSQTFASGRNIARLVKQLRPQTRVVVGGPHAAMVGTQILDCRDVDVVVCGEGERTLVELLEAFRAGRPLDDVAGIAFREDGHVVQTPPRPLLKDLDELCLPHEDAPHVLHNFEQYPLAAFSHVFATRGCPYNCFFCGSRNVWGRDVRFRSADNVVEELCRLGRLGIHAAHFDDDTFGVRPTYIRELCQGIGANCPGLNWSCELHVNLVNDETIGLMAEAGCRSIQLGIESGNDEILRQIRKGFTIDKALAAVETVRRHGVAVQAFFMVGFPQETEETLADTVAAMKKVRGMLSYSIFTPYPGTEAFEYCRQNGLVGQDYDVALFNHQSPANCFCRNISRKRFRRIVSRIERMVDRNNHPSVLRRVLTGKLGARDILRKVRRRIFPRARAAASRPTV